VNAQSTLLEHMSTFRLPQLRDIREGTLSARHLLVRIYPRFVTQRGLGVQTGEPAERKADEDPPRSSVSCPPPSSLDQASRYSYVAPRRTTVSMPPVSGTRTLPPPPVTKEEDESPT
jgi:hypothetical protein